MFSHRTLTVLCLLWLLWPGRAGADDAEYGPLFHQFKLTLEPGHRTEVVGPLYYQQTIDEENDLTRSWVAPPIFSYTLNEDLDYEIFDFLWKGITYNRHDTEYRFQLLQLFSFSGGQTQSETNVSRFTLFPFYFQQRSPIPEKNYTALVPIYGRIRERLFRDDIKFVFFPIYGQSRKRDVVTDNYLYPFFHLRHGDGLKGWQFWPLFGAEHKETTTRTNHWGDVETIGGHDKLFALWPIYFNQRTGLGTTNEAHHQAVLPFYSYLRSPQRDSTSWLWLLGVTHTVDRVKQFDEWGAPWPLIVFTRGEGKTVNRVWPLFSQAHNATQTSEWYLWPVYKYNRLHSAPLDRERTRILFFLYSDTSMKHTETGQRQRLIQCWPLFSSRRDLEGRRRLQIFAPLEPFLPNNTSVERDLAPLWSLWRSEKNPKTGAASQSLLWNLYRREETGNAEHGTRNAENETADARAIPRSAFPAPRSRKTSLLFGLFQYQSGPDGRRWRVFYIPFGKDKSKLAPSENP
jgi:hypothetical protein